MVDSYRNVIGELTDLTHNFGKLTESNSIEHSRTDINP